VDGATSGDWRVEISNLHPDAVIESETADLSEARNNLARTVQGTAAGTSFRWRFPRADRYRFAAIGDTGGGHELRWVLTRAEALGADFVLHMGDFNYGKGEYLGSVAAFDEAGIPTYVAIGNHDFYEGFNSVHPLFRQHIGPRNASFELGGIQFINVDTAAGFVPAGSGHRGTFLEGLDRHEDIRDVVVFTHKPLRDPREGHGHSVPGMEYGFLHRELKRLGVDTMLVGHIHIKDDFDDDGIRTLISGQGLAHADLIVDRPIAEVLLGDVTPDGDKVAYRWAPLEMPFEMHCNPRAWEVLVAIEKPGVLRQLKEICATE
jgi:predicted phosphodiesterase